MLEAGADDEDATRVPVNGKRDETVVLAFLSGCGVVGIGAFIGLVVLLCSIHTLDPEDQVVISGPDGKYVRNGPKTVVLAPERKKLFRKATRLSAREYALVKNSRSGEFRHEPGPGLLFLGAYDTLEKVIPVVLLQRDEYMRLVDQMTGSERVVRGPSATIPEPFEIAPNGVEKVVVLGMDLAVLIRIRTTGMLQLVDSRSSGGVYVPRPYEEILEVRRATLLSHRQYAVVKSNLEGSLRHDAGPKLLQVSAYEELVAVKDKILLRKGEYVRLRDKKSAFERVVTGPQAFVPKPYEITLEGKQRAIFLDLDTAALVLNRSSGEQRLITQRGVFVPSPYEQILEKRELIRVLPHEAMLVRDAYGIINIFGGGTGASSVSFFLKPFCQIVEMTWSSFSDTLLQGSDQNVSKISVSRIDMRSRKMAFRYHVLTHDNVELILDGIIFWRVMSVGRMVNMTSDPVGDVWYHARSAVTQAVSKTTLPDFMLNLNSITAEAFQRQAQDGFYAERGVAVESMEITRFDCADQSTANILHSIIETTVNRVNNMQQQVSSDEVRKASLEMDIQLERKRTNLILVQATNERLQAEVAGDTEGLTRLGFAEQVIGGLNATVPSIDTRLDLYKLFQQIESRHQVIRDLASGSGGKLFFLTPKDLGLSLKMEL